MSGSSDSATFASTRRKVLGLIGGGTLVSLAGCLGDDDDDDEEVPLNPVDPADLDDLEEGGELRVGVGSNVDSFDGPHISDTTSTLAQSLVMESLVTTAADGSIYPWLAEDFEVLDVQDVDRLDYEEYMSTFTAGEEGAIDTDGQQEVIRHPEDTSPAEGDEVRTLLFDDAGDAVDDGTYGVQIRYHLREGIEFHNGEEMTAENVVESYERHKNSLVDAQYFDSTLYYEEIDEYTVDIYAQVPDAEAERELPPMYVYTVEQAQLPGGELDPREGNDPIGTGPYEFVDMSDEQWVDYEKFDNYWVEEMGVDSIDWVDVPDEFPDGPVIDEVTFEIIPDDPTRTGALRDDEIDVTTGISSATLSDFDDSDDFTVTAVESGGYDYFQVPVNQEPWDDQRLRQAFNMLVPRQLIVDNIFDGWARPAWMMMPEIAHESGLHDPEALEEQIREEFNEHDPERAEELIEEVFDDYDIEPPMEIQLEVNSGNDDRVSMVELVAESMEETDMFDTTIEDYEWTTYTSRVLDPEYGERGHIGTIGLSGTFNPESFVDALHHSGNIGQCCNLTNINEPWIDEQLEAARFGTDVAQDPDLRRDRYEELVYDLEEYAGSAIAYFSAQESVIHDRVKNWGQWPMHDGYLTYALYAPVDERVAWIDD